VEYVNCGANYTVSGGRIKTKGALKASLMLNPQMVLFYRTSLFESSITENITGASIPEGVTLQVCGPDPYANRKWHASVQIVNGKIKVT
jgi:hypothetical protein